VVIVTDILSEVFGYDKYTELTSEKAIRGTFCDIAIKLEGRLKAIVEVKSVAIDFRQQHIRQAVDYATREGVDWVVLTNAMAWQVYRVGSVKPVSEELVAEFNLLDVNPRTEAHLELLYLLSREGVFKDALEEHYLRHQATSRHLLGALMLTEPVLAVVRRELRRMSPEVKVSIEELQETLATEVLKRDVTEGEEADAARKRVQKTMAKGAPLRVRRAAPTCAEDESAMVGNECTCEDTKTEEASNEPEA